MLNFRNMIGLIDLNESIHVQKLYRHVSVLLIWNSDISAYKHIIWKSSLGLDSQNSTVPPKSPNIFKVIKGHILSSCKWSKHYWLQWIYHLHLRNWVMITLNTSIIHKYLLNSLYKFQPIVYFQIVCSDYLLIVVCSCLSHIVWFVLHGWMTDTFKTSKFQTMNWE